MDPSISSIKEKEQQLRDLSTEIESAGSRLPQLKTEKRELTDRKRKVDEDLRNLQKSIGRKKEELNAKKSSIKHFYSDQEFAKTVNELQRLLERQSFTLSEEKKYVAEINSLNRSKKHVQEWNVVNDELEKLLEHKRQLRDQVDKSYHTISQMTVQIKDRERKLNQLHYEKEQAKKELDKLYYEKYLREQSRCRRPHSDDKPAPASLSERTNSDRLPSRVDAGTGAGDNGLLATQEEDKKQKLPLRRKPSGKSDQKLQQQQHQDRYQQQQERYQQQQHLLLCETLIHYLQCKMPLDLEPTTTAAAICSSSDATNDPAMTNIGAIRTEVPPAMTAEEDPPPAVIVGVPSPETSAMYLLPKKKSSTPPTPANVVRRTSSKKNKKDKAKMRMVHNMEVIGQFDALRLRPPSTVNEIPQTLEQLQAKKQLCEKASVDGNVAYVKEPSVELLGAQNSQEELEHKQSEEQTENLDYHNQQEPDQENILSEQHELDDLILDTSLPSHDTFVISGTEEPLGSLHESDTEPIGDDVSLVALSDHVRDHVGDHVIDQVAELLTVVNIDDDRESGICSNTEDSIGAFSRSNSNSDCDHGVTSRSGDNVIGDLLPVKAHCFNAEMILDELITDGLPGKSKHEIDDVPILEYLNEKPLRAEKSAAEDSLRA